MTTTKVLARARLADVEKKSGVQILTELAQGFETKDEYLKYLEGVAMLSFTHALCTVGDHNLKLSDTLKSMNAHGRAVAFLLQQELEIQTRLNKALCGREIAP